MAQEPEPRTTGPAADRTTPTEGRRAAAPRPRSGPAARVAVVTGAGTGIGRAIALRLAADGAAVALGDIDAAAVRAVAAEITAAGGRALPVRADVSLAAETRSLISAAVEEWGRLDIVVNNAGIAVSGSVTAISENDWDRVLAVNLKGVWLGMRYGVPHLRASGGGAIVNMSSVQALLGFPGRAAYAATKGAIISLTRQASVEYAKDGVRVNCVAPGTIKTPMNERIAAAAPDPAAEVESWRSMHPLGGWASPKRSPPRWPTWPPRTPRSSPVCACASTVGSRSGPRAPAEEARCPG